MATKRHKFPHYPRLFSAFILTSLLISAFIVNWEVKNSKKDLAQVIDTAVKKSTLASWHVQKAKAYYADEHTVEAQKELTFAAQLSDKDESQVLGTSTDLFTKPENKTLEEEKQHWLAILAQKPQYRDGWLYLAYIANELHKKEDAQVYAQKALSLDPNYLPSQQMVESLE